MTGTTPAEQSHLNALDHTLALATCNDRIERRYGQTPWLDTGQKVPPTAADQGRRFENASTVGVVGGGQRSARLRGPIGPSGVEAQRRVEGDLADGERARIDSSAASPANRPAVTIGRRERRTLRVHIQNSATSLLNT